VAFAAVIGALTNLFTTPIGPAAFAGVAWGILGGALPGISPSITMALRRRTIRSPLSCVRAVGRAGLRPLLDSLGRCWVMQAVAFKPYACGTMTQPFIDCAIKLAADGVRAEDTTDILCEVGEGTVDRLWEPLAVKRRPPTPYAAKFSTPFCMAVGFLDRNAGLAQFSEVRIHDPAVLALSAKIRHVINPNDEYPRNFPGHLRATLNDGNQREFRQPHLRGGAHAPLSAAELETKFLDNVIHGGWSRASAERLKRLLHDLFALPRLDALTEFRA
jgi:2-methylcitrate dehydratase PrpD